MKVLVVDDEVIITRALKRAFESKGHEVSIAHAGEEGLEQWQKILPDVVMLDVVMPGLTGPQVIEEYKNYCAVKKIKDQTKIILMTAHSGIKGREAALALGAHDFIQKPFENVFDLVRRIELL
jgi:CheY-like chemotaxis protein